MNTLEGNKLIHTWLGRSWETDYKNKSADLLYHTSWDWLMPVVEKIENELDLGISVVIKNNKCGIYRYKGSVYEKCLSIFESDTKITATILAIIEFINWHNQITKQ